MYPLRNLLSVAMSLFSSHGFDSHMLVGPCKCPLRNFATSFLLVLFQFHDTFGTAVANVFAALSQGIRTIDSSVGGLGGCPYSPGATGNVATEDVLYALKGSRYSVAGSQYGGGTIDLEKMVDIGWWISEKLGRASISRAGRAIRARKLREGTAAVGEKAKL
jgi:hydroxymethylglutaryl-CoA lyase